MNISEKITTKGIADKLNITDQTVRQWTKLFNVPHKRHKHGFKYDITMMEIFETISKLRNVDHSKDTIQRQITPLLKHHTNLGQDGGEPCANLEEDQSTLGQSSEVFDTNLGQDDHKIEKYTNQIISVLKENTDLAEKYAHATYQIGQQEERIKSLEKENNKLEDNIKLLPDPNNYNRLNQENEFLKRDKDSLQERIKSLEKQNERFYEETQKLKQPWWKKIFQK